MSLIKKPDPAVVQRDFSAARGWLQTNFHMIQSRVRHKHRSAQLQKCGRLDHLDVTPQMANSIATIPEPASASPRLEDHLHRIAGRAGAAFSKAVQNAFVDVSDCGFYLYMLFSVECNLFQFHCVLLM